MDEFNFLREMYRRLSEFTRWSAEAKSEAERQAHDGAAIAIKCSIRDYLEMRKGGPNA